MAINYKALGQRIKRIREKSNCSQEDLAARVFVNFRHISSIETGRKAPSLELLTAIANALGVSADDLLIDSLEHSSVTEDSELHKLLLDCNKLEEKLLVGLLKYMKELLFNQGI